MSCFGEEGGSLIWKKVPGWFFGKERGKRQKEMQKLTSQFSFLISKGSWFRKAFLGRICLL